ncbi:hypothetical protein [Streptomyces sp. STCH 565 A]|uniref:hypothetical protein n=1 Tax=Streptomyces sp. STCH 565 A TaxID=2950532 RepID=UPI00207582E8|nr:hypothetical protein [Streptomyces sp. STCH 565 A]MCM8552649.1 hypothetical protein [Streptomyces sp. STCH 565 A]
MTENQHPQRPGAWPVREPVDLDTLTPAQAEHEHGEQYARYQADRAWNQLVLDNIRLDLERQPSPATVRAAATRWKTAITQLADELTTTRRNER